MKKFKFGGNTEGTLEIYDDHIEVFKKSKTASLMFGAIGNALSGKGNAELSVIKSDIINCINEQSVYWLYLKDGNLLYIAFNSFSPKKAQVAMSAFLSDIAEKS